MGYSKESKSPNFGIPNIHVEQTLSASLNPYSAHDINTTILDSTSEGLKTANFDGRIPLGLFIFDEDNILEDNFPNIIQSDIFKQIQKPNLIKNGDCRLIDYKYSDGGTLSQGTNLLKPVGNWGYLNLDGQAFKISDKTNGYDTTNPSNATKKQRRTYNQHIINNSNLPSDDNQNYWDPSWPSYFQNENNSGSADWKFGFGFYFPYWVMPENYLEFKHRLDGAWYGRLAMYDYTNPNWGWTLTSDGESYEDWENKQNYGNLLPPVAAWVSTSATGENASYNRCLCFQNFKEWTAENIEEWENALHNYQTAGRVYTTYMTVNADGDEFDYFDLDSDDNNVTEGMDYYIPRIDLNLIKSDSSVTEEERNKLVNTILQPGQYYQTLNQSQKIYDAQDKTLNPMSSLKVKFKMRTSQTNIFHSETGKIYVPPPPIDVSIIPMSDDVNPVTPNFRSYGEMSENIEDRMNENIGQYSNFSGYTDAGIDENDDDGVLEYGTIHRPSGSQSSRIGNPVGYYNSERYAENLDSEQPPYSFYGMDKSYQGGMARFKNTVMDEWETFEFVFNLSSEHTWDQSNEEVKDLYFVIQAGPDFIGRVLIDDIEVKESYDFQPECDVRKKFEDGNYANAALTKYWDKELQFEQYVNTTAPLEAQFYFYPSYPSNPVVDRKRFPMYNDFKTGKFYIYNIDWGDNTPKEFTSEPFKLGENIALYHTYETSGIFEVTATIIRMKSSLVDYLKPVGIAHSKKIKLRINVNEGLDEDFTYFGSEGFSFIPYKNSTPIIGGYSEQSSYYKTIKRQLGFITTEIKTDVGFFNPSDKLKTEIALSKMNDFGIDYSVPETKYGIVVGASFSSNIQKNMWVSEQNLLNMIPTYNAGEIFFEPNEFKITHPVSLAQTVIYTGRGVASNLRDEFTDSPTYTGPPNTYDAPSPDNLEAYLIYVGIDKTRFSNIDSDRRDIVLAYWDGAVWSYDDNSGYDTSRTFNPRDEDCIIARVYADLQNYEDYDEDGQADYIGTSGITKIEQYANYYGLLQSYSRERYNIDGELVWTGNLFKGLRKELGTSIGNTDITSIKYYNKPKNISDLFNDIGINKRALVVRAAEFVNRRTGEIVPEGTYYHIHPIGGPMEGADHNPNILAGTEGHDYFDNTIGIPNNKRYWKNIIPQDEPIYNREGLISNGDSNSGFINTDSQQNWLGINEDIYSALYGENYYYPVLERYDISGEFIPNSYPTINGINKIRFPMDGSITNENETNELLILNLSSEKNEPTVLSDLSGKQNLGFSFSDYKPKFDDKTLKPKKIKNVKKISISKNRGAF